MIQIGKYTPAHNGREALIQREFYGQGYIVKDEVAYVAHPEQVCYVPELSDRGYTHNEILAICDNQETIARACFDSCDWQMPETWFEELFFIGWIRCPACGRVYDTETLPDCPFCVRKTPE